jgi:uncharacterized protein YjbJ (UPF0337 family)
MHALHCANRDCVESLSNTGTLFAGFRFSVVNRDRYHARRWIMGSTTDKVSGVAQAAGKIKESAGKATGSEKLEAEGLAQQAKGKAEKLAGEAKKTVKDATKKVADVANKKL